MISPMSGKKILVVEDDPSIRRVIVLALKSGGYSDILEVEAGDVAVNAAFEKRPDLVILDLMLPGLDGLEVCRRLRSNPETSSVAIVMLTAKDSDRDIVAGLDAGANDYVTKPFSLALLFARVAALLRRSENCASACRAYKIGEHTVDLVRMSILSPDGAEKPLAAREAELLEILHRHRGEVLRREYLLDRVWGFNFYGNTRTLDQHIALVRRKLGGDSALLRTVRNIGYRLD